jgi:arginine N-succinyltransferase
MEVIRAVRSNEIDELFSLIGRATYGMTSLQISRGQLQERVELSEFAFARSTDKPGGEPYVLVMEDLTEQRLVGLSCIFTKVGGYEPFYSYRVIDEVHTCQLLGVHRTITSLHLTKIHDGPTEIGSLFLLPEYRGQGRGRLLSLSRFALMAMRPHRFADEVIAEMRGRVDESGHSPFWEAIGRHFFGIEYPQADSLSTVSKTFIEDLMPKYPIYLPLLPPEAREVIGQVHDQTQPALAMLQAEGFARRDMIDIFDGGPRVHCRRSEISAVQRTLKLKLGAISEQVQGLPQIIASDSQGFRAVMAPIELQASGQVRCSRAVAEALQRQVGQPVWLLSPKPEPGSRERTGWRAD